MKCHGFIKWSYKRAKINFPVWFLFKGAIKVASMYALFDLFMHFTPGLSILGLNRRESLSPHLHETHCIYIYLFIYRDQWHLMNNLASFSTSPPGSYWRSTFQKLPIISSISTATVGPHAESLLTLLMNEFWAERGDIIRRGHTADFSVRQSFETTLNTGSICDFYRNTLIILLRSVWPFQSSFLCVWFASFVFYGED